MGDTSATSSSTSSSKPNAPISAVNKRTSSDADLDDNAKNDTQNHGKRVVVFETFKLYNVQSAVCIQKENDCFTLKNLLFVLIN